MMNRKGKVGNAFCHLYLIILSLIAFFPLVWILLCSVKASGELTSNPTRFLPKHFTLDNFTHVIQDLGFAKNIGNSLFIAIITTCIAIVISSMAAYGIVRFFPKLGSIMSKVLVATYMFPPILLAIPYSMVMAKLGLVNTRIGLIIVYLSFSVPYAVWMLVGFFKTVPLGIEEAARVDGANKFQTFVQIVLPLVMPGIVATAIYTFMKTVGYAIVGTGYFGAELGRIMKEQEGARIVAVLDPENGQTIAEELDCDVETDLDTLYSREDVEAVIVATPNYLHKEPVIKAAEHGVNVFCEKPIALSYQDCDEMVRTCQEHGVIFMAGHVMNFFHGVRYAKKLINDGVIGKVLYCHSARNGWEEQQPTISWKKIREKSGGHLYHHIHELDCVQFLMGGMPEEVTMTGGNVAHQGEAFGDEDDMLFVNMQFSDNRYAVLEWGSAFHWPEHYVLIQGTKGAIKIDMCDCGGTLKVDGREEHFLVHESQEEDDDRTRIYHGTEMDGAIMYGKPGKKPPMWLHSIMKNEMKYLNGILHGKEVDDEFRPLLTGEAARAAIATADACTKSRFEDRKVKLSEIIGEGSTI